MSKHLEYLKYVLRHKWYVFEECRKLKVGLWQSITHDWTKFTWTEWKAYTEYFYSIHRPLDKWPLDMQVMMISKWDVTEYVKERFDHAWNHHQKVNKHHWQYWVLINDSGSVEALDIPEKYIREMVADWRGASRAINGKDDTVSWYVDNRERRILSPHTRQRVEQLLGIDGSGLDENGRHVTAVVVSREEYQPKFDLDNPDILD